MRQERLFALLTLFSFFFSVALLFHFSAEDSYITLRYARNLYEGHGPVFNIGDRINAMTSPWHVLFSAVLFAFTDHVDLLNKALGLVYLLLSAWMVSLPFAGNVALRLLVAALASASASAVLWAVGGLETPLLMALVSATVPLVVAPTIRKPWPCWRWPALAVLASLGFLTRYD